MRMSVLSLVMFVGLAGGANAKDAVTPAYPVLNRYTLGGAGGWDYLTVDATTHRLFISRSDRVLVMDTHDGKLLGSIADTAGVHGIALAPELGKGYTSNGRADSVTEFDLATLKPTRTIAISGHNPDAILFDAASQRVFTFNGRSKDISVIDARSAKVVATIPLTGKPEFAAADGKGRIFVNIEDTAELTAIDAKTAKVTNTWKLPDCEEPTGLALDIQQQRLFSTCQNGHLIVTDAISGKHVATVPIGKGPDAAAFDIERKLVLSSNGEDGTVTVIQQTDRDHYNVLANTPTQKSARTMTLDQTTHRIYLAAAEFGPPPAATATQAHPRASMLPDSFSILVLQD
jgi:YVTN family beta-propeller protein